MTEKTRNQIKLAASIEHLRQFSNHQLNGILKLAVQHLIREAQKAKPSQHKFDARSKNVTGGRMPVDTGALRGSLISEIDGGRLNIGKKSKSTTVPGYDATVAIARLGLGEVATFGWTVNYAEFQEFGTKYIKGNEFMTNAVNQWQKWVNFAVAETKIERNIAGLGIGGMNPREEFTLS